MKMTRRRQRGTGGKSFQECSLNFPVSLHKATKRLEAIQGFTLPDVVKMISEK